MPDLGRIPAAVAAAFRVLRHGKDGAGGGAAPAGGAAGGGSGGAAAATAGGGGGGGSGGDAAPVNPFAREDEQLLTSVKWLIGALAAIAALLVAGTQLSDLGQLTWPDDRVRMIAAGVTVVVVLVCVVVSLGLLAWVQTPGPGSDIERLQEIVRSRTPAEVLDSVSRDSAYHRGEGDLDTLLLRLEEASEQHYAAKAEVVRARLAAAGEVAPGASVLEVGVAQDRAAARTAAYANLRDGVRRTSQLDRHLRIGGRARRVSAIVLCLSLLSALSLVVFAWASHPPADPAEEADALPARPVGATLVLPEGEDLWADRLGETCADRARLDGVPVLALATSEHGVEVVTVPSEDCPEPVRVLVPVDEGTVVVGGQVQPAGG
ncbi:hypothetical protein [Ornithinimicrobium cerasi]|uniref:Uncharacterized protein n=1 Tax=Ornithinimicrobium cerasi TaxID=2248773 RepID=A0A285VMI5_9MICO|nr:hypothetical protein [Ornithinimicrobium cerasi]SOC53771.1 hypothetical protein SAMN05421879_102129 [Ornithinimicrobium cerasi]